MKTALQIALQGIRDRGMIDAPATVRPGSRGLWRNTQYRQVLAKGLALWVPVPYTYPVEGALVMGPKGEVGIFILTAAGEALVENA